MDIGQPARLFVKESGPLPWGAIHQRCVHSARYPVPVIHCDDCLEVSWYGGIHVGYR